MKSDHLAREADRLQNDEIFAKALDDMRRSVLDNLAYTPPDKTLEIVRLQQTVALIDEIRATLARYIIAAGKQQEDPGAFA